MCAMMATMTNSELMEQVRELRERGRTPKQIARALALPPAEVAPLIRAVAAARPAREDALVSCLVNQGWAAGLTVTGHSDWPGVNDATESGSSGLVTVLVARDRGGSVSVCTYLVDVWCLGVKNAAGPKTIERRKLPRVVDAAFQAYDRRPLTVPIDLARHLVFGAIDYARGLGFKPHADFATCESHLGAWEGGSDITFGRDGMPMYIQGPHDDAARIMRTLRRNAGKNNFHYVSQLT